MIPLATTTITAEAPVAGSEDNRDPYGEGYDTPTDQPAAWASITPAPVRAVIDSGGGAETDPGATETINATLLCDPLPELTHLCRVTDAATGQTYDVEWVVHHPGVLGHLASTKAGLTITEGIAA